MEAKNLRIGNFVSDLNASNSFFAKVKKLDYSRCYYGQFHSAYSDLKPIPITEEWLIKFGFYKWKTDEGVQNDYFKHDKLFPESATFYLPYFNLNIYVGSISVMYVHELQNLFFAITGQELELKTDV